MEEIRVITTATVLSVRYDVEDAQQNSEVEYEVEATDVVGAYEGGGSVSLNIGDKISHEVLESVWEGVESRDVKVIGVMVPQHHLSSFLCQFEHELEVYPLYD